VLKEFEDFLDDYHVGFFPLSHHHHVHEGLGVFPVP